MIPSGLMLALLLAATPLFALGAFQPMLPALGLGWMLGVVALALLDGLISRARDAVDLRREVPAVLSLDATNRVEVVVHNRIGRSLRLILKDDPPERFAAPDRTHYLRLAPWQREVVSYLVTPHRRGDHHFGGLHLRGLSRLRLAWWQRDIEATEEVRVYPNLQQLREFDALARRGRIEEMGLRSGRFRGEGTEFESLREYIADDSYRQIDWKATARRGSPITRQYQLERNQTLLLLIDAGRMMSAQAGEMTRLDYAINAALMLAHVAERMGDSVGLLAFSDRIKAFVAPVRGAAGAERMLEELYGLEAELVESDYRAAIAFLRARARKRAMVCAFTDLVDPDVSAQALSYLASLRPQHLPMVATLRDSEVTAMAEAEPATAAEAYEKAVAQRTMGERELALARLRSRGVQVADARPEELSSAVVGRYLAIKRRGLL